MRAPTRAHTPCRRTHFCMQCRNPHETQHLQTKNAFGNGLLTTDLAIRSLGFGTMSYLLLFPNGPKRALM